MTAILDSLVLAPENMYVYEGKESSDADKKMFDRYTPQNLEVQFKVTGNSVRSA